MSKSIESFKQLEEITNGESNYCPSCHKRLDDYDFKWGDPKNETGGKLYAHQLVGHNRFRCNEYDEEHSLGEVLTEKEANAKIELLRQIALNRLEKMKKYRTKNRKPHE